MVMIVLLAYLMDQICMTCRFLVILCVHYQSMYILQYTIVNSYAIFKSGWMDLNKWMAYMWTDRSIGLFLQDDTTLYTVKTPNKTSTKNKVVMFSVIGSILLVLCAICGLIEGFAILKKIRSKSHNLKARLVFTHIKYILSVCYVPTTCHS